MLNKFWKYTLFITVVGIVLLVITYVFVNKTIFKLNGDKVVKLQLNQSYSDAGATATVFKWNISKKIKTYNDIDTTKIGTYNVVYTLNFLGHDYTLNRKVQVIDDIPPIIKLNGDPEIKIYVGDNYVENGATADDNYDKDLTKYIKTDGTVDTTKAGIYEINYSIEDSSGNKANISRVVTVEKKKELIKKTPQTYNLNDPIVKYIKNNNYDVSIGYYNLITGKKYFYRENEVYYGASLIKTLDAIYLYDKNLVNDSIKNYIKTAISISDNDSHYYLVDYIGKENLRKYGINLGAKNTLAGGDYYFGNTTVYDQLVYLKKLYTISKNNEELKSFFINDYGNYIKINNLTTMHKYGYLGQYYHDVGIIFDSSPYIVIILTKHGNDDKEKIINNLSKLIYQYHIS